MSDTYLFSNNMCGKTIMLKIKWKNLKCEKCDGKLKLTKNNDFEEVKECVDCGWRAILVKKIRRNVE